MAVVVTHNTPADGTFSASGSAAWDEDHAVAGLGTMAEEAAADYTTTAGLTAYLASPPAIGGTAPAAVTATTLIATTTPTTLGNGSAATHVLGTNLSGGTDPSITFSDAQVQVNGRLRVEGLIRLGASDVNLTRAAANSIIFDATGGSGGTATSRTEINKTVTGIADATATAVFTVTVPNAAHSANIEVTLNGSLGAGGAIGADEAGASIKYNVMVNRTAGVNAVAVISAGYGSSGSAGVAGSNTCTVTGDLGAISGAVGAANTFTIRVTVTKGGGASANHTCTAHAVLVNKNATGVTIA
jgi:hypothetical protein